MSLMRLNSLTSCLSRKHLLLGLVTTNNRRGFTTKICPTSNADKSNNNVDEDDQPIQYSTSPAATWLARHSQQGVKDEAPRFQSWIVRLSTAIFIIYFTMLRESNDIDDIFDKELGDHFKHIDMDAIKKSAGVPLDDSK